MVECRRRIDRRCRRFYHGGMAGAPPDLRMRWGCPLALAVTLVLTAAISAAFDWGNPGPITSDIGWEAVVFVAMIGAPFAALAVARTRDWLAWLLGVALTAALWGYDIYELHRQPGANFVLGFVFMMTPIAFAALCLAVAGMRGRIPDWGLDGEDGARPQ
jgi:peptidoglycan/LPS O-acetylase OafA/YrhL